MLILFRFSHWDNLLGGGGAKFTKDIRGTLDDIVVRAGKNLDMVFLSIAATLVSPPFAVLGALLSTLYASTKQENKKYRYGELKEILHKTLLEHNYRTRRKLIEYGVREIDAERLVHQSAYEDYIDRLVTTYA